MRRRSFIDSKLRGSRTKILIIYNTSGKNINRNGCCSLFIAANVSDIIRDFQLSATAVVVIAHSNTVSTSQFNSEYRGFFQNQTFFYRSLSSLLPTSDHYLRFAFDWFIELLAIIMGATMIVMAGSFYSGLCLYISGMVTDIKTTTALASHLRLSQPGGDWSIIVKEIDFHNEIIE